MEIWKKMWVGVFFWTVYNVSSGMLNATKYCLCWSLRAGTQLMDEQQQTKVIGGH